MAIYQKLLAIMAAIDRVPKNGRNEFYKYDYTTEADLVEVVRGLLVSNDLAFFPTVKSISQQGDITTAEMEMTFVDAETGERLTSTFYGAGQDKNDKGPYKAYTGAIKYALLKTFLISTGDDPESDDQKPPKNNAKPPAKPPANPGPKLQPPTKPEAKLIETADAKHLYAVAKGFGWSEDDVKGFLQNLGYASSKQIPIAKYPKILDEFSAPKPEVS